VLRVRAKLASGFWRTPQEPARGRQRQAARQLPAGQRPAPPRCRQKGSDRLGQALPQSARRTMRNRDPPGVRGQRFRRGPDARTARARGPYHGRRQAQCGSLRRDDPLRVAAQDRRGHRTRKQAPAYSSACRTSTIIASPLCQSRRSATSNSVRAAANACDRVPAFRRSTGPRPSVERTAT
jgi:hypothetical protein